MNILTPLFDGLHNLVANLGTPRDKSQASYYGFTPLSDMDLVTAYRGNWLPRKIVRIPAEDAVRKWRTWSASKEEIDAIERVEREHNIKSKMLRAMTLARLTGGAAVYFRVKNADPSMELDIESVGKDGLEYAAVLTKQQLNPREIERDISSPLFGKPVGYTITSSSVGTIEEIHPSHLVVLHGSEPLSDVIDGANGWGDSVLQHIYESLLRCDSTTAAIAAMVFEAKIDVINVPGLMKNLSDGRYESQLTKRFGLAAMMKGINGTLILDEKEQYSQKSASFAALPDIMDRFAQEVSGAADIPMTRLWGRSAAGMNSTGESDLRNYYDAVQTNQELVLNPAMFSLNEAIIRSALGSRPEEIYPIWSSLWQTTEKERAEIGSITAGMVKTLSDAKVFPAQTLAEAAANTMIESGAMPGLDAAVEEFGLEPEEPLEAELLAGATSVGFQQREVKTNTTTKKPVAAPVADAAPRSLYVRRDVVNAAEVIRWARSQGLSELYDASELHVTICYVRVPVDWMKVPENYEEETRIAAGGPRMMDQFGEHTVLLIPGRQLQWRHKDIIDSLISAGDGMHAREDLHSHPDYQPHISLSEAKQSIDLSSVKPFTGQIILGPEIFEEIKE